MMNGKERNSRRITDTDKVPVIQSMEDVFNISEEDLPLMSQESGLSALVLESKIKDRAYPRADMEDDNAVIFLRIPQKVPDENAPKNWIIKWTGLLMIGCDSGLLTISNSEVPLVLEVPTKVHDQKMSLTYPVIFFTLTKESLSRVEGLILSAEMDLVHLESIPMSKQPRSFLNITYDAKKEIGQAVSWLIHTKSICQDIIDNRVRFKEGSKDDQMRIKNLSERCGYLLETAQNVGDGLSDAIDFYLNNTSFQMNKVMRFIAVMTALTIIPTVIGGMLSMNLIDTPWNINISVVATVVALIMAFTAWVYFKLGWLKS